MYQEKIQFANFIITIFFIVSIVLIVMLQRSYKNHVSKDNRISELDIELVSIYKLYNLRGEELKTLNKIILIRKNEVADCNSIIDELNRKIKIMAVSISIYKGSEEFYKANEDNLFKNKFLQYIKDYKKLLSQKLISKKEISNFNSRKNELMTTLIHNTSLLVKIASYEAILNPKISERLEIGGINNSLFHLNRELRKLKL